MVEPYTVNGRYISIFKTQGERGGGGGERVKAVLTVAAVVSNKGHISATRQKKVRKGIKIGIRTGSQGGSCL